MASGVGTDVPQVVHDMHRDKWMRNSDGLGVPQASADTEQARGYRIQIHRVDSHSRELITRAHNELARVQKGKGKISILHVTFQVQHPIHDLAHSLHHCYSALKRLFTRNLSGYSSARPFLSGIE